MFAALPLCSWRAFPVCTCSPVDSRTFGGAAMMPPWVPPCFCAISEYLLAAGVVCDEIFEMPECIVQNICQGLQWACSMQLYILYNELYLVCATGSSPVAAAHQVRYLAEPDPREARSCCTGVSYRAAGRLSLHCYVSCLSVAFVAFAFFRKPARAWSLRVVHLVVLCFTA